MNSRSEWVGLFLMMLSLSGCQGKEAELKSRLEELSQKRGTVLEQLKQVPFRWEQQVVLKRYFSEVHQLAVELKGDSRTAKRIKAALAAPEFSGLLERGLMPLAEWELLKEPVSASSTTSAQKKSGRTQKCWKH